MRNVDWIVIAAAGGTNQEAKEQVPQLSSTWWFPRRDVAGDPSNGSPVRCALHNNAEGAPQGGKSCHFPLELDDHPSIVVVLRRPPLGTLGPSALRFGAGDP